MVTNDTYSKVVLVRGSNGEPVEAMICKTRISQSISDWNNFWFPKNREKLQFQKDNDKDISKWPQSIHWNWESKLRRVEASTHLESFSIICEGKTQALIIVDLSRRCVLPSQKDKKLVYIDFIEVAPWNRDNFSGIMPIFRGCGYLLIRQTVEFSRDNSCDGRIGLHSLPQSEKYYINKIGMTDLGIDTSYQNLRYYEMTPEQSKNFLFRSSK